MLQPIPIPGLFITGTDTGIGKTVIAGAIARWFRLNGHRVAVCKPVATGCRTSRENLVSEDAEFLAHCADSSHPLDIICPQRYMEPLAPGVAARRAKKPLDWPTIDRGIQSMSRDSDVMIIEGVGGLLVPMDDRHTVLDMIAWLQKPAIVVARPALGTLNHTLMTVRLLQSNKIRVAGVIINRYPVENASIAEETNPRQIEKWAKVPVLAIVPDEPFTGAKLPAGITSAIDSVDWFQLGIREGMID